jgi:tetratricopeptide (TPR) repeat protein
MAYRKLAVLLNQHSSSRSEVVLAARKAFEQREQLPLVERYLAEAQYRWVTGSHPSETFGLYRAIRTIDPDHFVATNNLAMALLNTRRWVEAESLALRATTLAANSSPFYIAGLTQLNQERLADAASTANTLLEQFPGNTLGRWLNTYVAQERGDFDRARVLLNDQQPHVFETQLKLWQLALLGHVRDAEAEARFALDQYESAHDTVSYIEMAVYVGWLSLVYREDAEAALQIMDEALERFPLSALHPLDRPYYVIAELYATAGRPSEAERLMAESERLASESPSRRAKYPTADAPRAAIAAAHGEWEAAIRHYRSWYANDYWGCASCGLTQLGRMYESQGQIDSALAVYERAASARGALWVYDQMMSYGPLLKHLGDLYTSLGNRERAIHHYSKFLDLWRNADPVLQPLVNEAREALARVTAEP